MRIIFIGIRNFNYFSRELLDAYRKIIVVSNTQVVPEWLAASSTVVRVPEIYDGLSKVNQFDLAQCLSDLAPLVAEGGPHGVFCNEEANLEVADAIRAKFALYNHMHGTIDHFRDKLVMKKIVQHAALRTPAYTLLEAGIGLERYAALAKMFNNKFIVKPVSSVGSRGVYKIFNQDDFARFVTEARDDGCVYEAEEFIDGELYQYDLALQGGVELYCAVSHYSCPMADLQEGRTLGSMMLGRETELHKRITTFGKQCAQALGAKDGCFHMEIFHSNTDELVFLEVAARSPGLMTVPAYVSWEGINMYDIELRLQAGQDASAHAVARAGHVSKPAFFVVFPKVNGLVDKLNTPAIAGHFDLDWRVQEGKQVDATTTNVDFAGKIFVSNETEGLAKQDFIHLTEQFIPVIYR